MANDPYLGGPQDPGTRLSSALIAPLLKAYQEGGFGLSFLVLGAVLLGSGTVITKGFPTYLLGGIGLLLILVPCYFFFAKEIRPIGMAQRQVRANAELIDSVQDAAETMTRTALELQALSYKYADQVAGVLGLARPAMRKIPPLRKIADSPQFERADWLTTNVVQVTKAAERVIQDVQQALRDSDARALKKYVGEFEELQSRRRSIARSSSRFARARLKA